MPASTPNAVSYFALMCLVGGVAMVAGACTARSPIAEAAPVPATTVRVMRAATEIEVRGPIAPGVTARVREQLDAHPGIGLIHLNSEGGSADEALALAALVRERGLITYTATRCEAACTLTFLAGRERLIDSLAVLGIASIAEYDAQSVEAALMDERDKAQLQERGVRPRLVLKAGVPSPYNQAPSNDELIGAGIVTRVARNDEVAITDIHPDQPQSIDTVLARNRVFSALRDTDPPIYAEIVADVKAAYHEGRTRDDVLSKFAPRSTTLFLERLPYASDEAILAVYAHFVAVLKVLQTANPRLCTRYGASLDPGADAEVQNLMPGHLHSSGMAAVADVLRTGKERKQRPPDEAGLDLSERIIDVLRFHHGDEVEVLWTMNDPSHDPVAGCRMLIAYFSEVLKLPSTDAANTLRYVTRR